MPIRNLTERRRLPRLGKIHLGIKELNAKKVEYPKAVDYFVCPLEVQAEYGEKPKELEIMFISNDLDQCASQYYRAYKQTVGLVCKGDGYRADALLDTDNLHAAGGEIKSTSWASSASKHVLRQGIDCLGEGFDGQPPCPLYSVKGCKRLMMLQFVILRVPGIGVWQIDTSSVHSIQNINGFLEMLGVLTGGKIAGIPLTLRMVPQEVAPDGKKKTVHVLQLATDKTMPELLAAGQQPMAQLMLPAPDEDVPEDFFPEEVEEEAVSADPASEAPDVVSETEPETVEAEAPAPTPAHGTLTVDILHGMLTEAGVGMFDACKFLDCKPGELVAKVKAWVRAGEGRTVKGCIEAAKPKAAPAKPEQAPLVEEAKPA